MAKREKMSWQSILVVILVAAMILGLVGINIFTSIQAPAPAAPTTKTPSPITNIQVQTEGNGQVQVTPNNP
jgi:cytoskeletal protein RodZ